MSSPTNLDVATECSRRSSLGRHLAFEMIAAYWRPILLVFLPFAAGYFLSYFFRTINAVIAGQLTAELGLDASHLGLMTSVYFLTFAAIQLPLGVLLDRFGPRRVQSGLLLVAAIQSRTRNYDCPPDCRPHLVRASRSEAPGIRFKSYPTFGRMGFQSWNDCGQPFDINGRGVRQWRTSSRVTLATPYYCVPRSSGSEARGPMCGSRLARVARPAFGRQPQQLPRLSAPLMHRKPLGGQGELNLIRGIVYNG